MGGGHAGCEAAMASARLGGRVLLLTLSIESIARMSCNPAMGGIAKGQIIREIDALGGYSGIVSDRSTLQFRMLNRSKGPAMWSPRTQNDCVQFSSTWKWVLAQQPHLQIYEDTVSALIFDNYRVTGVRTLRGHDIFARTVILTNGTFLNGMLFIGQTRIAGGRMAEKSSVGLSDQLADFGFTRARLKTGTPPRLDKRSIDFSAMERQPGDDVVEGFSFLPSTPKIHPSEQIPCYITYTNPRTHDILRTGFADSPMFSGLIEGVGPRYCPSVEDKIHRFADRDRHQLFIEPQDRHGIEIYVNGFSTSLDVHVQFEALRTIAGLQNAHILKPGYAVEYDYFPPTQLHPSLATRHIPNLFFAGQINGTTGYEEAAAQGLMAGINAMHQQADLPPFILGRDEAYIGVLIDDLVTKGTKEPYRMFTSRAEFRTLLRQDNADLRLTGKAYAIGMVGRDRMDALEKKMRNVNALRSFIDKNSPSVEETNAFLEQCGGALVKQKMPFARILTRPEVSLAKMIEAFCVLRTQAQSLCEAEINQVEIAVKYDKYIQKERGMAERLRAILDLPIPPQFPYGRIAGLSAEAKEKLLFHQPGTLREANSISGVSPSDMQILLTYMGR